MQPKISFSSNAQAEFEVQSSEHVTFLLTHSNCALGMKNSLNIFISFSWLSQVFETASCFVAQIGFGLQIMWLQHPEGWDHRHMTLCLITYLFSLCGPS